MAVIIPDSHRDLLQGPVHAVLTTVTPDGTLQSSLIWIDYDGCHLLVNTTLERQKGRNMQRNPKVALLIVDPMNTSRWLEVRGSVTHITTDNAETHADILTRRYTSKQHFYGDIYPVEQKQKETRVIVKIEPVKISLDAIFK